MIITGKINAEFKYAVFEVRKTDDVNEIQCVALFKLEIDANSYRNTMQERMQEYGFNYFINEI